MDNKKIFIVVGAVALAAYLISKKKRVDNSEVSTQEEYSLPKGIPSSFEVNNSMGIYMPPTSYFFNEDGFFRVYVMGVGKGFGGVEPQRISREDYIKAFNLMKKGKKSREDYMKAFNPMKTGEKSK